MTPAVRAALDAHVQSLEEAARTLQARTMQRGAGLTRSGCASAAAARRVLVATWLPVATCATLTSHARAQDRVGSLRGFLDRLDAQASREAAAHEATNAPEHWASRERTMQHGEAMRGVLPSLRVSVRTLAACAAAQGLRVLTRAPSRTSSRAARRET
jgi:hypothetical protein